MLRLFGCPNNLFDFCDENCYGPLLPDQSDVEAYSLSPPKYQTYSVTTGCVRLTADGSQDEHKTIFVCQPTGRSKNSVSLSS